jgi:hypothetical protein
MGFEAAVWIFGNLIFLSVGLEGAIASLVILGLAGLSLWTVDLLTRAPRIGVWLGLGLQALLVLHGLILVFVTSSLFGIPEIALGLVTAVCVSTLMPAARA